MAPNYPQALAFFDKVERIESLTATLAHGITPSQIQLRITPQRRTIAVNANLKITYGNNKILLQDCQCDVANLQYDQSGQVFALTILDRRWKWRHGQISGQYNLRWEDGKIIKDKEKNKAAAGNAVADCERTPKQLAKLCLEAMGEKNYDIDDMPNDARPLCQWDVANPAHALQELCDQLGCRIVLQLNNRVAIRRAGVGRQLPGGAIETLSSSIDPPDKPSSIVIVCGPTRYQDDFELEAVGLDTDGSIKAIDDLSYAPTTSGTYGKWSAADAKTFHCVSDVTARKLALKSVFRWYRIKTPTRVKGFDDPIERIRQLFPLGDELVQQAKIMGTEHNRKAFVYGFWSRKGIKGTTSGTQKGTLAIDVDMSDPSIVPLDFSVDSRDGVIKFDRPMYDQPTAGTPSAPGGKLAPCGTKNRPFKLRVAVTVREPETGAFNRYERKRKMSGTNTVTQPRYVRHDEIVLNYLDGKENNKKDVDKECDYYLDALEKEYDITQPESATYAEIIECNPDGAIQSVTWTINQQGGSTSVSRNDDDGSPVTLPYKIRRANEKNKKAAAAVGNAFGLASNGKDRGYQV